MSANHEQTNMGGNEIYGAKSNVAEAERRAWNYWFVDGLFHILSGTGCLLLAASLEIDKRRGTLNLVIALCCFLMFFAILYRREQILEWLKWRVTYPRTGYVPCPYKRPSGMTELHLDDLDGEPPREVRRARRNRTLRSLLGIVASGTAVIFLGVVDTPWICLPASILYGVPFWRSTDLGLKRSLPVAFGMSLVGLGMSLLQVGGTQRRFDVLFAGTGIVLTIDGATTLIGYLRRNPARNA